MIGNVSTSSQLSFVASWHLLELSLDVSQAYFPRYASLRLSPLVLYLSRGCPDSMYAYRYTQVIEPSSAHCYRLAINAERLRPPAFVTTLGTKK
jgi:hypothetical protein